MTTRVFRRQFSEMTELVNTLAFLPDSTDQIEALKIREGDAKEIISIKNSIAEMKDAEIERANKLLSLISYDQESGFIKIWRLLSPTIISIWLWGSSNCVVWKLWKRCLVLMNAIKSSGNCVSELPRNMRNAAIS